MSKRKRKPCKRCREPIYNKSANAVYCIPCGEIVKKERIIRFREKIKKIKKNGGEIKCKEL